MNEIDRLSAIEEIKGIKADYFRGVDTGDSELVRNILAEDCILDYNGCFVDPATGEDFFPAMNVILHGHAKWSSALAESGIVSAHQGHNVKIEIISDSTASAIWSMTDRLFFPAGSPHSQITGYGYYHETYEKIDDAWKIKTIRMSRLRVEAK